TVKGEPDDGVRPGDVIGQALDGGRTAALVDVPAVGFVRQDLNFRSEPGKDLTGYPVGRAVCAIEGDPKPGQIEPEVVGESPDVVLPRRLKRRYAAGPCSR